MLPSLSRLIFDGMGLTWPNLDARTVTTPGYYWSEKWKKLARLSAGEKLPRQVAWEFLAGEGEGSSSQIARRLFDRYPDMDVNEFTYTTTTPLDRRLKIGDPPASRLSRAVRWGAVIGLAMLAGRWLSARK